MIEKSYFFLKNTYIRVIVKNIRIYQSDDSLIQAGCEILGWCETRSRYAKKSEIETAAPVPEDMKELDVEFTEREIESLTISIDASLDRFTVYVELEYKG